MGKLMKTEQRIKRREAGQRGRGGTRRVFMDHKGGEEEQEEEEEEDEGRGSRNKMGQSDGFRKEHRENLQDKEKYVKKKQFCHSGIR